LLMEIRVVPMQLLLEIRVVPMHLDGLHSLDYYSLDGLHSLHSLHYLHYLHSLHPPVSVLGSVGLPTLNLKPAWLPTLYLLIWII
jgi:hypothetical protein